MNLPRIKPAAALLIAVVAITCIAAVLATTRHANANDSKAAPPKPALTVTTVRPASARLPLVLAANGNVAAWQEAVIGSESAGLKLLEVRANVGDIVKKGQVLAVFSTDTVNADVAQARAALLEAQANATAAQADAARSKALQSSGALSEQQITQSFSTAHAAQARVEAAKATLEQQMLRLKYTQVLAPDSGIISSRSATVGAVAGVGTELFRMIRQGRLEWRAEVTSSELARIAPGTRAVVKAASGAELAGKARMVAPTVDPQSRVALVYVDLPPQLAPNAPFKAGMFASGRFELGQSPALTLPQQAVVVRDGFAYVFRLNPDGRVSQLKVGTGRRVGERIEVTGLPADAQVVDSGAGFLNDGDLVRTAAVAAR